MFNLGFGELAVIFIVLIIAVGPDRLPTMMKGLGKTIRTVRQASRDIRATVGLDELMREDVMAPLPRRAPPKAAVPRAGTPAAEQTAPPENARPKDATPDAQGAQGAPADGQAASSPEAPSAIGPSNQPATSAAPAAPEVQPASPTAPAAPEDPAPRKD